MQQRLYEDTYKLLTKLREGSTDSALKNLRSLLQNYKSNWLIVQKTQFIPLDKWQKTYRKKIKIAFYTKKYHHIYNFLKYANSDFPGGPVTKPRVPDTGGPDSVPGQGIRLHMPQTRSCMLQLKNSYITMKIDDSTCWN